MDLRHAVVTAMSPIILSIVIKLFTMIGCDDHYGIAQLITGLQLLKNFANQTISVIEGIAIAVMVRLGIKIVVEFDVIDSLPIRGERWCHRAWEISRMR
ncbi:Uncharacterised protein [Vibrio cholerae]|nr:Uncharacterised protein [Vibrio cholerae]CSB33740.1 Uncharacterised protein [Vibrio cholerae]CSB69761.1 Uncharacterised protein [Vibrio cholerae]CSC05102.1 Uncharacterised protein [Vibrio cholerae]CSC10248.1 Uncharacterised protein [Vibrio cholerae]